MQEDLMIKTNYHTIIFLGNLKLSFILIYKFSNEAAFLFYK
jgi:hypothetical protein